MCLWELENGANRLFCGRTLHRYLASGEFPGGLCLNLPFDFIRWPENLFVLANRCRGGMGFWMYREGG